MAPKGGNAKKESGRAKKAENEAKKQAAAEAEKARHRSRYNVLYILMHLLFNRKEKKQRNGRTALKGKVLRRTRKRSERKPWLLRQSAIVY